ncbi:MAG: hypothetical protein V7642_2112 [Burkholderiales bacterium]
MIKAVRAAPSVQLAGILAWVVLLAYFFAETEIQIEGPAGWAANLPTWRIEQHWLLDIFWGGRAMTGYHAWMFPFIALFFHFPLFFLGRWCWRAQCRVIACIMLFWIAEDFLWFVLNPAYGLARFNAAAIPWHKRWLWIAPADYWIYGLVLMVLLWISYRKSGQQKAR